MATIACPNHRPQMATVRPGVFSKLTEKKYDFNVENVNVNLNAADIRTTVLEVVKANKDIVDIGEAKVIVAGGRNSKTFYLYCLWYFRSNSTCSWYARIRYDNCY